MLVLLNGQLVPEEQAVVSVFDRSFLYGDGLFETMLVRNGRPFRFDQHLERLRQGSDFVRIRMPFSDATVGQFASELISRNNLPDCILRLTLSRGVGVRGYSPRAADKPVLVMTLHPAQSLDPARPPTWRLATASFRLPAHEPLARFKTCNKLAQVLARAEAEAQNADEALLLNTDGQVVEGASSNLFWISGSVVCTPPLESGILAGVTRGVVQEVCSDLGVPTREEGIPRQKLRDQDGIFLSLSTLGIVEATASDGHALRRSPLVATLRESYWDLVRQETGSEADLPMP